MLKPQPLEETEFAGQRGARTLSRRIIIAALLGAVSVGTIWLMTALASKSAPRPIREGYGVGSMTIQEKDYFTEPKCNGCKVECFDRFVVVYIDKSKEPTWADSYIKVIPWEKVESMTLLPPESIK
ncbi:MAG: hypothetical protein IRY99_09100 [Isosphaeraceae bacterium]|nr:hypothetical protein [Isosphaeraceae bacterium]